MDICHKSGVTSSDESSDQTHHVDNTYHESRNRSHAWGDNDTEGDGKNDSDSYSS